MLQLLFTTFFLLGHVPKQLFLRARCCHEDVFVQNFVNALKRGADYFLSLDERWQKKHLDRRKCRNTIHKKLKRWVLSAYLTLNGKASVGTKKMMMLFANAKVILVGRQVKVTWIDFQGVQQRNSFFAYFPHCFAANRYWSRFLSNLTFFLSQQDTLEKKAKKGQMDSEGFKYTLAFVCANETIASSNSFYLTRKSQRDKKQ